MRLILFCLLFLALACGPSEKRQRPLASYFPQEAASVLRLKNVNAFKTARANSPSLKAWLQQEALNDFQPALEVLDRVYSDAGLFIAPVGDNYFLLSEGVRDSLGMNSTQLSSETLTRERLALDKIQMDSVALFRYRGKSYTLYSDSESLLRTILENPGDRSGGIWATYLQAANRERLLSLLQQPKNKHPYPLPLQPNLLPPSAGVVDLDAGPGIFKVYGAGPIADSLPILPTDPPELLRTPRFAPLQSTLVQATGGYERSPYGTDSLLLDIHEAGWSESPAGALLFLHTHQLERVQARWQAHSEAAGDYQGKAIRQWTTPFPVNPWENWLPWLETTPYYVQDEGMLVLSSSLGTLEDYLSGRAQEQGFEQSAAYRSLAVSLSENPNFLRLRQEANPTDPKLDWAAYQLTAEPGLYHTTYVEGTATVTDEGAARKLMELELEAPAASSPQFVRNHYTGKLELMVQDQDGQLYRFGSEGQLLWKKPLPGLIQGRLHEVDLYRNSKWQTAFTAGKHFLILDRNGKTVPPFDMEFDGETPLNPLAVFDYDQDKDYRFLVTQGKQVRSYDRQGKAVKGFTYNQAEAPVQGMPVHLRMENRDYLVFRLEDGRLRILNRIGRERVPVPGTYDFASAVQEYRNQFAFTDREGKLYLLDRKGKITPRELGLSPDHGFTATPTRLITMDENVLRIGEQEVTLDFGLYTAPRYFFLDRQLYVTVTDLQAHKTYLFNASGELLPGFPVFGNSEAELANLDDKGLPELIVLGTDNNLLLYTLQ